MKIVMTKDAYGDMSVKAKIKLAKLQEEYTKNRTAYINKIIKENPQYTGMLWWKTYRETTEQDALRIMLDMHSCYSRHYRYKTCTNDSTYFLDMIIKMKYNSNFKEFILTDKEFNLIYE